MSESSTPINGSYIGLDGQLHNLDGGVGSEPNEANRYMTPFCGVFIDSTGHKRGLEEIVSGGGGSQSSAHSIPITLAADQWSNSAQTVANQGITESILGVAVLSQTVTADQFAAWSKAQIIVTEQSNGAMVFTAFGNTPSIDIPIVVLMLA